MSAPVLAYPNSNKECLLKMDASKLGLGTVLCQNSPMGGTIQLSLGAWHYMVWRSIATVQNLSFLAMKWSIKHFQTYLLGCCLKVCTDNNPLVYFLTSPNMDAMKQRWINELAKYDFSLEYQKGKNNTVADALCRISEEHLSDEEAHDAQG